MIFENIFISVLYVGKNKTKMKENKYEEDAQSWIK